MLGYWDDSEKPVKQLTPQAGCTPAISAPSMRKATATSRSVERLDHPRRRKHFPREVEEYLYRHPKVQAVQVFGVPDAKYGEEVCAWIQLKSGMNAVEKELRDFCTGQIAHQKIPRYIRFVTEFPMTVTGKAQKFVMREQMSRELSLSEARRREETPSGVLANGQTGHW